MFIINNNNIGNSMGIPNIHSGATPSSPLITSSAAPQHLAPLLIGELTIEGHSYVVRVESSEPLVPSPDPGTIEKIKYLVNLYLEHIKCEGVNLNDVIIQELDEDGLAYVTANDLENKRLNSSKVDFDPSNPFNAAHSLPPSLQNLSLISIRDVFRSIIDPLIVKKNEERKEEMNPPLSKKTSEQNLIFQRNFEEEASVKIPKTHTLKVENRRTAESSHTTPNQVEDQTNTTEEQNLDEQPKGFWSWNTFRNYVPRFFFRSNSYEVVDSSKEIKEKTESFLQKHPEIQEKFTDISNLQ